MHSFPTARIRQAAGFTLTELVIVLVLIGIVAAFAAPRLDVTGFERQVFADELLSALRHARAVAERSGCPVAITANAASNEFSAVYTGAGGAACPSAALPHPTRGGPLVIAGEIDAGGSLVFDASGRTSTGLVIGLASGESILIEAGSGYVHR